MSVRCRETGFRAGEVPGRTDGAADWAETLFGITKSWSADRGWRPGRLSQQQTKTICWELCPPGETVRFALRPLAPSRLEPDPISDPNLVIKDGHKVENGVLSLLSTFGFLHEAEIGLAML
jgi:hypothetical protein